MRLRRRGLGRILFVDFPVLLLGVFIALYILTAAPPPKPRHIPTPGVIAVTDAWAPGSNDDVDFYVQDPQGTIVYFADESEGLMHLEHDDLGTAISGTQVLPDGRKVVYKYNGERVVLTGTVPGEYIVNVQMYAKRDPGPLTVTVQLVILRGGDRVLLTQPVVLARNGQEETAFRFTVDAAGNVIDHNRLPHRFLDYVSTE